MPADRGRPAVFLDRDGTIIEQVHYLSDPEQVRLIEGGARAMSDLRAAGYLLIVVTNQSAIGRGLMTTDQFELVCARMVGDLERAGAGVDGIYHCPVAPSAGDRTTVDHPDRKPGPGMLLRAARERGIDLAGSWMVGDMISDTLAGRNAGVRGTVLVRTGLAADEDCRHPSVDFAAADLAEAARLILRHSRAGRPDGGVAP